MSSKSKGGAKKSQKAQIQAAKLPIRSPQPALPPPTSPDERSAQVYALSHPYDAQIAATGISSLTPAERIIWSSLAIARDPAELAKLSSKAQKEVWKHVNDSGVPLRTVEHSESKFDWGKDRHGVEIGKYSLEQFERRSAKVAKLSGLLVRQRAFLAKRRRFRDSKTCLRGEKETETEAQGTERRRNRAAPPTEDEVDEERVRRKAIAELRMDLYGETTGSYAQNPDWDDVVPMPIEDSKDALAVINYSEDYAEAISYLRAVMATNEHSTRTLRLTEHIITMNPAHYTVWLFRFAIIQDLKIPLADEREWLNGVSLTHLKNYQIWHHRRLLTDLWCTTTSPASSTSSSTTTDASTTPSIESKTEMLRSEQHFMAEMLAEDAKNYHVWSYRQYLIPKLDMFSDAGEMKCIDGFIQDDVRNNSAWSHRFFVVFSNPEYCTPDSHATEHDPKIPAEIVDREIKYAQDKILLAPQNQSPWNYMKGVLVKGGRPMKSEEGFVSQFVQKLGTEDEKVTSTHALDLLADIHKEKGEKKEAALCLERLGEKWDPIRKGYWDWRRQVLEETQIAV